MKKLIAVLIALAMVLSMSVMSFAAYNGKKSPGEIVSNKEGFNDAIKAGDDNAKKKQISEHGYTKDDGSLMDWDEAWQAYYSYLAANITSDPTGVVKEIQATVDSGYVAKGDAIKMIGEAVMGGAGGDGGSGDFADVIDKITGGNKEPEISTDAYVEELKTLINGGADFETVSKKISDDLASGKIVTSQLPDIAKGLTDLIDAGEITNNETVQQIIGFIKGIGGSGGEDTSFPDFGDITLPSDEGNSESGSFLDTIFGILDSINDIFNPDAGDGPTEEEPTTEPDGTNEPGGGTGDPDEFQPDDTGDVSFVAVAAVAAVAGAALILTRKKHNDAE